MDVKGRQMNVFSKDFTVGRQMFSKAHGSPVDFREH